MLYKRSSGCLAGVLITLEFLCGSGLAESQRSPADTDVSMMEGNSNQPDEKNLVDSGSVLGCLLSYLSFQSLRYILEFKSDVRFMQFGCSVYEMLCCVVSIRSRRVTAK